MIWREFMARVEKDPGRIAVQVADRATTYHELARICRTLAADLPRRDGKETCRVLVKQRDPFSFLVHVLSCWCAGVVPVLLREAISEKNQRDAESALRPAARRFERVDPDQLECAGIYRSHDAVFDRRQETLVINTSGTTGTPKLVALPAEAISINASVIGSALGLTSSDCVAVCTPLSYMYGFLGGCIATLWVGGTVQLIDPKAPPTVLQSQIRRYETSVVQGPPSLWQLFMAYWNGKPFSSVRLMTAGGESIVPALTDALCLAFPDAQKLFIYGMTEAGPRLSHEPFETGGGVDGCIGRIYDHFDWRIDPFELPGARPGAGRLAIRGPTVFLGYITRSGSYEGIDPDGFFVTNDVVSREPDGRFRYWGRADRMFKTGGKLVNPDHIEQVLGRYPQVLKVLCVQKPHTILGFVPAIEVMHEAGSKIDQAEFTRYARLHLEPHSVPRTMSFHVGDTWGETGRSRMVLSESGKKKLT